MQGNRVGKISNRKNMMKKALLTGITGGLGCKLAARLGERGWNICGICRREDERTESLLQVSKDGGWNLELKVCDFVTAKDLESLQPWLSTLAPQLDTFIHLAAPRLGLNPLWKETLPSLDCHWQTGARAAFQIISSIIRPMSKKEKSHILFVLSEVISGVPPKGMSTYTIGKYALWGLAKAVSSEYEPRVKVTCLAPSIMDTDLLADLPETAKQILVTASPKGYQTVESFVQEIICTLENHENGR